MKQFLENEEKEFENEWTGVSFEDDLLWLRSHDKRVRAEYDKMVQGWVKLPIKYQEERKLGPVACDRCGGQLSRIRGHSPKDEPRFVCPTCAVENLEQILLNTQQAQSSLQGE